MTINPYTVLLSSPMPSHFHGRAEWLIALHGLYNSSSQRPVHETMELSTGWNLYGPRGIGKSALIYKFIDTIQENERASVLYLNMESVDMKDYPNRLCEALVKAKYAEPSTSELTPFEAIHTALSQLSSSGKKLMICLDRTDHGFSTIDSVVDANLRSITQKIPFVFISRKPCRRIWAEQEQHMQGWKASPLVNCLSAKSLGLLAAKDIKDIMLHVEGFQFDTKDVDELVTLAGGHPYLLLLACEEAFNQFQKRGGTTTRVIDNPETFLRKLGSLDQVKLTIESINDGMTPAQAETIRIIASGEQGCHRFERESAILDDLEFEGWIVRDGGYEDYPEYRLFSSLYRHYVCRHVEALDQDGTELDLTLVESGLTEVDKNLFRYFVANPNRLLTYEDLVNAVWPGNREQSESDERKKRQNRDLDAAVYRIRKRLRSYYSEGRDLIENERKRGYRFHLSTK